MIRKGSRVIVLDLRDSPQVGVLLGKINWDRTYYRVQLDDGRIVTSERVHAQRESATDEEIERSFDAYR